MNCRPHCAACCIAPSISSPIPGMPVVNGISKPAGVRCVQLDAEDRCKLFGRPERPAVCRSLAPHEEMCGESREQAMRWLGWLEQATAAAPRAAWPAQALPESPPPLPPLSLPTTKSSSAAPTTEPMKPAP